MAVRLLLQELLQVKPRFIEAGVVLKKPAPSVDLLTI